jgi:hypothetical protein
MDRTDRNEDRLGCAESHQKAPSEEKAESEKVEQVARAILSAWDRLEIDGATHPFVGVNLSVDAASYLARAAIAAMEPS